MNSFLETVKKSPLLGFFYKLPFLVRAYHFSLAFLAALWHGFPSRKLIVIGVTGTKGKTTVCNLIADILNHSGYKTGVSTTVNFRLGEKEWLNDTKQTMLGRFQLQKLLSEMVRSDCKYAVVETSSEGILQYRQRFIDYKIAVFTNLSPEHIERHGSFEKYREAKVKLFEQVAWRKDGIGIYNLDDDNVDYFLQPPMRTKYGYFWKNLNGRRFPQGKWLGMSNVRLGRSETKFNLNGESYEMPLIGEFNVYNAAAAICAALSQNIPIPKIKQALKSARQIPGRMEIMAHRNFTLIIDYAHEPLSLESLYRAVREIFKPKRIIAVLGAQGGGRDKWKRAAMGKIAARYCDMVILTNEDPYDENPLQIIADIESGFSSNSKFKVQSSKFYRITDRREAIKKAVSLAQKGDAIVLSGKGGEVWMCVGKGRKIPWNERAVVEESLK